MDLQTKSAGTEVPVRLGLHVQSDWFAQHAFSRILSCVMFFYKIASFLTTVYKDLQTSNHKQHFFLHTVLNCTFFLLKSNEPVKTPSNASCSLLGCLHCHTPSLLANKKHLKEEDLRWSHTQRAFTIYFQNEVIWMILSTYAVTYVPLCVKMK